jgi:hypothetical protein
VSIDISPVLDPDSDLKKGFKKIDQTLLAFFSLEALGKIVLYGLFFNGSKSYLK